MNKNNDSLKIFQATTQLEFGKLFSYFYPQVAAYAAVILDDKTAGEDIAQDVFVYVWEKREELLFGEKFRSYLFKSTYTRCLDYIKKNKHIEKYERDTMLLYAKEYNSFLDNDAQPLKELFSKDFEQVLNSLLEELPLARKQVFLLVYSEGLKAKEVSEKLKMPLRTVESHIYLALKFLRKRLSTKDFLILTLLCKFF